ncbi:hypothetical protein [Cellulomonas iranensis]|uniref:hypothetical protein n=1 Tax=Cellulomonas iranensis TaxID=76862 RepID=UPI000B3C0FC6|nr:hypothetical protein [Cellulomonas iranensis]
MSEYLQISPEGAVESTRPPFRFEIAGRRFELPALDSADVPLPLIPLFLILSQADGDVDAIDADDKMRIAAAFITYLETDQPKIWAVIKRQKQPIAWVNGLIRQWGAHSRLDPRQPASGD